MKICVYGAGAIGGLMAAWLSRSGHEVSLVARGAQLEAIRRDGLRVRSKSGTESFRIKAEAEPAKLGAQDYVLVTVKAAYMHCAKAFMRSKLWHPHSRVPRSALPTMGEMLNDQTGIQTPLETQEEMVRRYAPDL